jgi:hypothetical protein
MKLTFYLTFLLLFPATQLGAVTEAIFTSVTGNIEIRGHKGHIPRTAHKDTTVLEGERIVAGRTASATLRTFDGSEIQISPNTDVWLEKLQKPNSNDKIIQFKMEIGQVLAKVKHLFSAKSSFEISAGGVICGVRGTQYQVRYEPSTKTVYLGVVDGTVYATSNGKTWEYGKGSSEVFRNGVPVQGPQSGFQGGKPGAQAGNSDLASLQDLRDQFQMGLSSNGNRIFTDPSVEGSLRINLSVNVSATEAGP